ncbi:NAD(P)H-dependent oxidoreductase [Sansalvadorimonas verongulae]|uniref:NAD(P)H-dependent oxidoreductase n=1 Tax=Sansalvadorimonas verongulae TaxID=2172824 RepID=UPI0012BCE726|nr:NAD(P)H-dependent oxidoreductase [Sansalvadorimonas verongulae]MTI11912.1 NAD(P)H-dependent oxidoreductase [Sansalvadorimonas verongulae]
MTTSIQQHIIDAYQFRHACKSFDASKKISDKDFNFIMETGRLSPSSFGYEPWKFLVVQNMELREKLKPLCQGAQGQLPTASHFVVILARKESGMHHTSEYVKNHMVEVEKLPEEIAEMKGGFYRQFQEEHFQLTESPRAMFDWACKQTYIALGNMMTSAALVGIDSCPVEGFDRESVERLMVENNLFNPEEYGVSVMVAFGYRADEPPFAKTRSEHEQLVQWFN